MEERFSLEQLKKFYEDIDEGISNKNGDIFDNQIRILDDLVSMFEKKEVNEELISNFYHEKIKNLFARFLYESEGFINVNIDRLREELSNTIQELADRVVKGDNDFSEIRKEGEQACLKIFSDNILITPKNIEGNSDLNAYAVLGEISRQALDDRNPSIKISEKDKEGICVRMADKMTGFLDGGDTSDIIRDVLNEVTLSSSVMKRIKTLSEDRLVEDNLKTLESALSSIQDSEEIINRKKIAQNVASKLTQHGERFFIEVICDALENIEPSEKALEVMRNIVLLKRSLREMKKQATAEAKKLKLDKFHNFLSGKESITNFHKKIVKSLTDRVTEPMMLLKLTSEERSEIDSSNIKEFYRKRRSIAEKIEETITLLSEDLPKAMDTATEGFSTEEEQQAIENLLLEIKVLKEFLIKAVVHDFFDGEDEKGEELSMITSELQKGKIKEEVILIARELKREDNERIVKQILVLMDYTPDFKELVKEAKSHESIDNLIELNNKESSLKEEFTERLSEEIDKDIMKRIKDTLKGDSYLFEQKNIKLDKAGKILKGVLRMSKWGYSADKWIQGVEDLGGVSEAVIKLAKDYKVKDLDAFRKVLKNSKDLNKDTVKLIFEDIPKSEEGIFSFLKLSGSGLVLAKLKEAKNEIKDGFNDEHILSDHIIKSVTATYLSNREKYINALKEELSQSL